MKDIETFKDVITLSFKVMGSIIVVGSGIILTALIVVKIGMLLCKLFGV